MDWDRKVVEVVAAIEQSRVEQYEMYISISYTFTSIMSRKRYNTTDIIVLFSVTKNITSIREISALDMNRIGYGCMVLWELL